MTNLQIAYQQLLETQRANRANEALKQQQVAVAAYEAQTKATEVGAKVPLYQAQVRDALRSADLKDAQIAKVAVEIPKIAAETNLTNEQTKKVTAEINKVIVSTALDEVQKSKILAETYKLFEERRKVIAEVAKTEADTARSKAEKTRANAQTLQSLQTMLAEVRDTLINSMKIDPGIAKAILGEIAFN